MLLPSPNRHSRELVQALRMDFILILCWGRLDREACRAPKLPTPSLQLPPTH